MLVIAATSPTNFAVPPLGLVAAMCELRVGRLVRQLDLDVELDRLAGEALAEEGRKGRPGFVADHLRDRFADHLLWRETEPLRVVPVDELEAGLPVALRDGNRGVVRDRRSRRSSVKLSWATPPPSALCEVGVKAGCGGRSTTVRSISEVASVL